MTFILNIDLPGRGFEGPKWKAHRRIITPSFHFNILDSYGEVFAEKSQMLVDHLGQFDGNGYFDITKDLTKVALDIITGELCYG